MLLLIIGITIIVTIISYILAERCNREGVEFASIVLTLIDILLVVILFSFLSDIYSYQGVEQKITMYETQNQQLERKIDVTVKNYMNHEKDTYKEFKAGDGMALITTYPELRSNELVKEQMNTYQSNNRKIAKLKEKEIDYNVTRWWIYFGGK